MTTSLTDLAGNKGGYYDRTDASKNFDQHVFIAGRILQSAEMNEIQTAQQSKLKAIADALFKDGDIVRDARCAIDSASKIATLEQGAIYARGGVRGVAERTIQLTGQGTEVIGLWLVTDVITDSDDKDLLDPAAGNRGFNEPGAYRLRVQPQWGLQTDLITDGEFFPVYYSDLGELRAKEPPPNLDSVTQAIARYDVDSNGSNYIVNGFRVTRLEDGTHPVLNVPCQVYSVASGRARVNGFGVATNAARRVYFVPRIDLKEVGNSFLNAGAVESDGRQRVTVGYRPLAGVIKCLVKVERTITMSRTSGLTDNVVINSGESADIIVKVSDSVKEYKEGVDFAFEDKKAIVWTSAGQAPTGGQYDLILRVWTPVTIAPADMDDAGIYVKGAVVGLNSVQLNYTYKLPRIDRLYVDETGQFDFISGVATDYNPASPTMPSNLLSLAQVHQVWTSNFDETYVSNDGVRMVSMSSIEQMNSRMDDITDMVAQLNLISDLNVRDASKKLGLFVDPFNNDDQRDQGKAYTQDAAITGGCLQLPIAATVLYPDPTSSGVTGVTKIESCDYTDEIVLSNTARTTSMKVNPYMAFAPFPGNVVIVPQIDRWVETKTAWTGAVTKYFTTTVYAPWTTQWGMHMTQNYVTGKMDTTEQVSSTTADAEYLREQDVTFTLSGFAAGEKLTSIKFDDIEVLP